MAHFLAPNPPHPELPVFFNVDGVVGAPPAQNNREDVLLVQFILQVIGLRPPPKISPATVAAARAVQVTGRIDPATITAIRALQEDIRAKLKPQQVVDGRISPAKVGYSYGSAFWTIVHLNNRLQEDDRNSWPRIDKIAGCPAELQQMVIRTLIGT
jgi:hypothetical protein